MMEGDMYLNRTDVFTVFTAMSVAIPTMMEACRRATDDWTVLADDLPEKDYEMVISSFNHIDSMEELLGKICNINDADKVLVN